MWVTDLMGKQRTAEEEIGSIRKNSAKFDRRMSDKCLRYEQSFDDVTTALEEMHVHREELDMLSRKKATKDELFIFQDHVSANFMTR